MSTRVCLKIIVNNKLINKYKCLRYRVFDDIRNKAKIAEEIEQPRMDSVRTTPPAILDYSLLSPITDHGGSCHTMTTLGYSDTLLSPGSISSLVHCECDTSTDSDAEFSDMYGIHMY